VSVGEQRRSKFDYPNSFILLWTAAMFVAFGLLSNFYDQESLPYNLGQGAFITLIVGAILYVLKWTALKRKRAVE